MIFKRIPINLINAITICHKMNISTIFALSSGYGKCGVAVIRVSGPDVSEVVKKYGRFKILPDPRKAILRRLRDPLSNEIIDQGLILWFPAPKSFTGEDCCEFHVHGGSAVLSTFLNSLGRFPNLRPAEPGEFTKRAFYSGKLDLTAVEGLNDLINSETEFQRKQALLQMEGSLFHMYKEWKEILIKCVADIEAYIDFGEDENIENDIVERTKATILDLRNRVQKHLNDGRRGERLRSGVNMAIVGAPNVGKSSLLNKLCRRPAAIVSPQAGTTRDLIQIDLDVGGYPVVLTDTAGIRSDNNPTADEVELEGIKRARMVALEADLVLLVLDSSHIIEWFSNSSHKHLDESFIAKEFSKLLNDYIRTNKLIEQIHFGDHLKSSMSKNLDKVLLIFNKVDLLQDYDLNVIQKICKKTGISVCSVSCKTNFGLEFLIEKIISHLRSLCSQPSQDSPCYTQARHRLCLTECLSSLNSFLQFSEVEKDIDLAGHNLRMALNSLGKITGHVSTEQILDKIFAEFCIGK